MAERGIPSYEGNSYMEADERRKAKKVIKGPVSRKSKSLIKRVASDIIETDGRAISSWLWDDIIKPRAKDVTMDVLEAIGEGILDSVSMLLFGELARNSGSRPSTMGNVSYRKYYVDDRPRERRSRNYVDDIELDSYYDARSILDELLEIIETHGEVTVADYYDACGVNYEYTDNYWGWTNLRNSDVKQVRGGKWVIRLPKPTYF